MLKKFITQIQTALTDRANEVEDQLLMPDQRYQELNTKLNEVMDQIGQNLPPGKERLLLELDSFWVKRDALVYPALKAVQPHHPVKTGGITRPLQL